jgi:cytoplasmic tRNA 2-thiolation protein 1
LYSVGEEGLTVGTYCGVFRRQALDRGSAMLGINHILTGHNADDMAETVLMNRTLSLGPAYNVVLRGDIARLNRCTEITTSSATSPIKRSKPFKYAYEKEIVMYAYFLKLDYFSTECTYFPEAFRGTARTLIKDLEALRPSSILDIIRSGEDFVLREEVMEKLPEQGTCERCGYMSSQSVCKACVLVEGLERGLPRLGIGDKAERRLRRADEELHVRLKKVVPSASLIDF